MILFNTECFLCQLKRNVETARKLGNEQTATAFCRELMQLFATVGEDVPSPGLAPEISGLFQKYYGLPIDRFQEEKRQANEFVLARMDAIRAHIEAADEPLLAALQCAILGNYLDFAVLQKDLSFALWTICSVPPAIWSWIWMPLSSSGRSLPRARSCCI